MSRRTNRKKSGSEELIGGVTLVAVFGLLYFSTHQWFWLFPLCFVGVPSLLRGVQRIHARRVVEKQRREELPKEVDADKTREILRIARANKGKVTPAVITLNSTMSLEDADRLLQDLSSKGYAGMNVTDSGRIEYEFPEFMDEAGESE